MHKRARRHAGDYREQVRGDTPPRRVRSGGFFCHRAYCEAGATGSGCFMHKRARRHAGDYREQVRGDTPPRRVRSGGFFCHRAYCEAGATGANMGAQALRRHATPARSPRLLFPQSSVLRSRSDRREYGSTGTVPRHQVRGDTTLLDMMPMRMPMQAPQRTSSSVLRSRSDRREYGSTGTVPRHQVRGDTTLLDMMPMRMPMQAPQRTSVG